MSISTFLRSSRDTLALTVLFALAVPTAMGETRADDYVMRAMQLLRSVFPGLPSVQAVISDERNLVRQPYPDAINPFTISLNTPRAQAILRGESEPRPSKFVLGARFQFNFQGHELWQLWISGPFVDDPVDKLTKEVNEHPAWSEDEVVKRLKAAGAKYGPSDRDEFLRSLPLDKLEPFTGPLEVVSADFSARSHPIGAEKPEAVLSWRVAAKWHSADGKYEADRVLLFEPFEGKLTHFSMSSAPRLAASKQ